MSPKIPIRSKEEYVRDWPCAVCGEPVTLRKIISGWIIECGCGELHRGGFHIDLTRSWKPKEVIPE